MATATGTAETEAATEARNRAAYCAKQLGLAYLSLAQLVKRIFRKRQVARLLCLAWTRPKPFRWLRYHLMQHWGREEELDSEYLYLGLVRLEYLVASI